MLASHGAKVVCNDLGGARDGTGADIGPADEVVNEITAMGGEAVANGDDVSDWEGAQRLVNQAIETFGDLHGVVNNAGILRDRMLVNMTEAEWDAVIKVHLKGTFAPARWASSYWREKSKAGEQVNASIVNTTSVSGIYGNPGQTNYGAAKMGIAAFTIIAARELGRYGVRVNAVAPGALTRMTEDLGMGEASEEDQALMHPRYIAPIVTWLCSEESARRERPCLRGVGTAARRRRGLGTRADSGLRRRSRSHRRGGPSARARRPCKQRHGAERPPTAAWPTEPFGVAPTALRRTRTRSNRTERTTGMGLNPEAVGATGRPTTRSWTFRDSLLYAVGIGAGAEDPFGSELEFTTHNSKNINHRAFPTQGRRDRLRRRRGDGPRR